MTKNGNIVKWVEDDFKRLGIKIESIEAVVIFGASDYDSRYIKNYEYQKPIHGKPISWEIAKPLLDYDFDNGYGAQECNDIYIWTKDYVFYIKEYDGSTCLDWIPRNPNNYMEENKE